MLQRIATDAALEGLNHLLRRERQARELLQPLAGRTARLQSGPISLQFAIAPDGLVLASDAAPDVRIELDARALAAGLNAGPPLDPAWILKDAHIEGDAGLA